MRDENKHQKNWNLKFYEFPRNLCSVRVSTVHTSAHLSICQFIQVMQSAYHTHVHFVPDEGQEIPVAHERKYNQRHVAVLVQRDTDQRQDVRVVKITHAQSFLQELPTIRAADVL